MTKQTPKYNFNDVVYALNIHVPAYENCNEFTEINITEVRISQITLYTNPESKEQTFFYNGNKETEIYTTLDEAMSHVNTQLIKARNEQKNKQENGTITTDK